MDPEAHPYIQPYFLESNPISMKTVFAINLNKSFEIQLLDLFNNKLQINLRSKNWELISSTRCAHIYSVELSESLIIVSTTNHNFMIFDQADGSYVKVLSNSLYEQSVMPNRKMFNSSIFSGDVLEISSIYQV
jgi:hypothetical protein